MQAITDLRPGADFDVVTLEQDGVRIATRDAADVRVLRPFVLAEIEDIAARRRVELTARLARRDGAVVVSRTIETQFDESRVILVPLMSACRSVVCPRAGDPADATECESGRCVSRRCDGASCNPDAGIQLEDDAGPDSSLGEDAGPDSSLEDAGLDAGEERRAPSSVSAGNTAPFTATDIPTQVPYGSELHDDLAEFDRSVFTARHAASYHVCASLFGPTDVELELLIFIDGSHRRSLGRNVAIVNGCTVLPLDEGHALDLRVAVFGPAADPGVAMSPNRHWNWLTIDEVAGRTALNLTGMDTEVTLSASPDPATYEWTVVPYEGSAEGWDDTAHALTVSEPGDYEVCAGLALATPVSFELDLWVDGARDRGMASGVGSTTGCIMRSLDAGQRLDVRALLGVGMPASFPLAGSSSNWLTVQRLPTTTTVSGRAGSFAPAPGAFVTVPYTAPVGGWLTDSTFMARMPNDYLVCAGLFPNIIGELDLWTPGLPEERERAFADLTARIGTGCRPIRLPTEAGTNLLQVRFFSNEAGPGIPDAPEWNWLEIRALH